MLKGGQSMLARIPDARESSDIDLVRVSGGDREAMAADYSAALQRDLGDHLRFVPRSREDLVNVPGVRLAHTVFLGDMEVMTLSVDLVPPRSRPVWRESEKVPFPAHVIETGSTDERPDLRVISFHDILAHKVSGMYTYTRDGGLPERAQDLVDVLVLALHTSWDGPATHAMLHEEFAWRQEPEQGEPMRVPDRFEVPNPAWGPIIAKYAAATPGLPYMNLGDAIPLARAFLDPLLAPTPPRADWSPHTLRWEPRADEPSAPGVRSGETAGTQRPAPDPGQVRLIEATGAGPPSTVVADQPLIDRWDTLSGGRHEPNSLEAQIAALKARTDLSLPEKIRLIREQILPAAGVEPSPVAGLDSKNLRFYAHQSGELFIHSAALKLNPDTTIDIGYHLDHTVRAYSREARASQLAFLDAALDGMTAAQAEAVALWRTHRGKAVAGVDPADLVNDLIDIHIQPLRDALAMRQKLIDDYGVEPHRVRVVYGGLHEEDQRYGESRWQRAHMLALSRIRDNPIEAREALVATIRGSGEAARIRAARAAAVAERLFTRHEQAADQPGPAAYALLWVRDSRSAPAANRNGLDTQPAVLGQIIDTVRANHPDRRIVLVGDDLFARRPDLRAAWEHDGVLDGVDADTLVKFWSAARNGGEALSPAEQALFFHKLITERDIIQIGTESGALEIPFLLGAPTVYLENMVYHLNKGNRWAHIWQEWRYGEFATVLDEHGNVRFDSSARPVRSFQGFGDPLPPPLPTVQRVQFGPDLPNPKTRQGPIIMDFPPQLVALTADRIVRLVDEGGLDRWPARLGYTGPAGSAARQAWNEQDWARSRYYADQLHRWLHTDATTPEAVGRKWDAIRLALKGVLEPRFTVDPEYAGLAVTHPYSLLHSDRPVPAEAAARVGRAYAADQAERASAVARALKEMLGNPELRSRAIDDIAVFRLEPAAILDLRAAMARVLAANAAAVDGPGRPADRQDPSSPTAAGEIPATGRGGLATPPAVVEAAERINASTTRLVMAAIGVDIGTDIRNRVGDPDFYLVLSNPADPSEGGRVQSAHDFTAREVAAAADRLIPMDDPAVDSIVRQIAVRELARTWAEGPYDSARALAAMEVVRERFRLTTVPDQRMDPALGRKVNNELDYNEYVIGEALRVQYEITQRALARDGVREQVLHAPVTSAAGQPLAHWTSDLEAARHRLAASGDQGVVLTARVPADMILMTPETALSGPRADAFVVLGRPNQAMPDAVAHAEHPAPRSAGAASSPDPAPDPQPGTARPHDAAPDLSHPPYDPRHNLGGTRRWHRQVGELLRAGPDGDYPSWWPRDDSGYAPQARDLDFLDIDQQQFEWFLRREAPLGMTPAQFRQFRLDLLEALRRDGIAPSEVDVRIKGSGARFFSGPHKELPTEASLAGDPAAREALRTWLGDDAYRPRRIPFDAMHKLNLDKPSDYDLDISSSRMVEYARRNLPGSVHPDDFLMGHGYLAAGAVKYTFRHLMEFRQRWEESLSGREISLGVFESSGSFDRSEFSVLSEHFRDDEDWKLHTPGGY